MYKYLITRSNTVVILSIMEVVVTAINSTCKMVMVLLAAVTHRCKQDATLR